MKGCCCSSENVRLEMDPNAPGLSRANIYFTNSCGLVAISLLGKKKWTVPLKGSSFTSPLTSSDVNTMIYVGSQGSSGVMYAVNTSEFKISWSFATNTSVSFSGKVSSDGSLIFSSLDQVYRIDRNGKKLWGRNLNSMITGDIIILKNFAFLGLSNSIACLNVSSGETVWLQNVVDGPVSSPKFGWDESNNMFILFTTAASLYSVRFDTGMVVWKLPLNCLRPSSVASYDIIPNDPPHIFYTCENGIYLVTPEGKLEWSELFAKNVTFHSSPSFGYPTGYTTALYAGGSIETGGILFEAKMQSGQY